jgi:hypothetical protein
MTDQQTESPDPRRWSSERARAWWKARPWPVGCNFIPSTASNQLEMWQAATFDPESIDRELGWAAELGFNAMRVYLHDLLWTQDRDGFLGRVDSYLERAAAHGIATLLVLFDDVWCPESQLGPQPEPHPGRHNSRWLESPGLPALQRYPEDPALRERLGDYVRGVIGHFAHDERVLLWDLYNEPGGFPSPISEPVGGACLPLLRDVFDWARDVAPDQPLTSGLWIPVKPIPEEIAAVQRARSDVISFHHYGPPDDLRALCETLRGESDRPLVCTEYLARQLQSRFETHLPLFRELGIGAIHWGLVSGRTQTIYPWWSWFQDEPQPEPDVWFHDVLRADGTPFDPAEVEFLRGFLGARD